MQEVIGLEMIGSAVQSIFTNCIKSFDHNALAYSTSEMLRFSSVQWQLEITFSSSLISNISIFFMHVYIFAIERISSISSLSDVCLCVVCLSVMFIGSCCELLIVRATRFDGLLWRYQFYTKAIPMDLLSITH